jgi:PAS domain S-box-containing protein
MRLGARDYLSKDHLERLGASLMRSLDRARERRDAVALEQRYRTLFEQLPVGVIRSTPAGETLEINPALLRILRFPDEATFRRETSLFKTEFVTEGAREQMVELLTQNGIVNGFETEVKRRDGTMVWIRLDISAVNGGAGEVVSVDAVVTDVDARRRAEAELRWSDTQRRQLLKQLINAQEVERQRIAQGIHDDAVQVMSAANMRLSMLAARLDDEHMSGEVDRLVDLVSLSTARLRDLLFDLLPPALERAGLVAALQEQLKMLEESSSLTAELTAVLSEEPSREVGILMYRIAQEAFANVRKHAHATRVQVHVSTEGDGLLLNIRDDGQGFDPRDRGIPAEPGHIGLVSMTERAALVGGWCRIDSTRGIGTTVSLWVPHSDDPAPEV